MTIDLKITQGVAPAEEEIILQKLRAVNVAKFGESNRRELTIPIYGQEGEIIGGLIGYTGRGWLYVSMLYIPEELRGRGIATRMLAMAEAEASARGCIGAYIDTMNPDALRLYRKQGFAEIGKLNGLEGGHSVTWLEKRF